MKRGEIYFIMSNWQETGSEQRAGRPAVIVSNDANNKHSEVVEIVYMTTQPKKDLPTHVVTRSTAEVSTILCEQIYSVSKQRLGGYIGELSSQELKQIDLALAISLGLDVDTVEVVRDPTAEELEEIRESVRAELLADMEPTVEAEAPKPELDAQAIKTQTERDLYKKFSEELLEILKGGATCVPNSAKE